MTERTYRLQPRDVQVVSTIYQAIDRRDLDAVMSCVDADVLFETRIEVYEGVDEVREMFKEAFASDFTSTQEGFVLVGGDICALTNLTLVGDVTGIESAEPLLETWTIEGGTLRRLTVADREEGIERYGIQTQTDNLAVVNELYDKFDLNNADLLSERLHDQVRLDFSAHLIDESEIVGRAKVIEYFASLATTFDEFTISPTTLIAAADSVVVPTRTYATGRSSGAAVDELVCHGFEINEGLILSCDLQPDAEVALEALCSVA